MRVSRITHSLSDRSQICAGQIDAKQREQVLCDTVGGTTYPVPAAAESPGHLLKNP